MARSRPSCSVSTRRLSEELNPRALTLKSFTPLCTTSTPGTACSATGACPVTAAFCSTSCGTTEMAAGASTMRSGPRDAPSTTISPSEITTASSAASAATVLSRLDDHLYLGRPVAQPAEDHRLRAGRHPAQGVSPVGAGDGAEADRGDSHRHAAQLGAIGCPRHRAADRTGLLGGGGCCERREERDGQGGEQGGAERRGRITSHTWASFSGADGRESPNGGSRTSGTTTTTGELQQYTRL